MFDWFKKKEDHKAMDRTQLSPLASLNVGDVIKIESYKKNLDYPTLYRNSLPRIELCYVEGNNPQEETILLAVGYIKDEHKWTVEKRIFRYTDREFRNYNTMNKQPRSPGHRLSYDLTIELAEMVVNNDIRAKKLAEKILNL